MISLRALARDLGVNDKAIRKGVASGRLRDSVGRSADGTPHIVDLELARREWVERARSARAAADRPAAAVSAPAAPATRTIVAGEPGRAVVLSLADAQSLTMMERNRKLKRENDEAEGRLVLVDKVAREAFESMRTIREAMLNIPARIAGELAAIADPARVSIMLDGAIRQALNEAADAVQPV